MTTKITEKNISSLANAGVQWQSVVVADGSTGLTAVAGRGYFINTTSGAQTVTLPASPNVGDVVVLKDYARTWGTNAVSIASNTFDGVVSRTPSFSTNGQTVTLVYMDNTQGWSLINEDTTTGLGAVFITATGGTITTSGDFKIHTFTGDGCFVVSQIGNSQGGGDDVDYLVVAGGGGAQYDNSGGGGAGGFRYSNSTFPVAGAPGAPLASATALVVTTTTYPVTVGAGGAGGQSPPQIPATSNPGNQSIFSTITATGGGGGVACTGNSPHAGQGLPGGSGGGAGQRSGGQPARSGGNGNTPPTSPSQGNNGGGTATNCSGGAGGGGAMAVGCGCGSKIGGAGAGIPNAFGTSGVPSGDYYYYSGGGGGGGPQSCGPGGPGGLGGGGPATAAGTTSTSGTANSGGGAGGGSQAGTSGSGGSGIVVIRYKFQ